MIETCFPSLSENIATHFHSLRFSHKVYQNIQGALLKATIRRGAAYHKLQSSAHRLVIMPVCDKKHLISALLPANHTYFYQDIYARAVVTFRLFSGMEYLSDRTILTSQAPSIPLYEGILLFTTCSCTLVQIAKYSNKLQRKGVTNTSAAINLHRITQEPWYR